MAGKIFITSEVKRTKRKPRFILVAVAGVDLRIFAKHLRKSELEHIASELGAELIQLRQGEKKDEDVEV